MLFGTLLYAVDGAIANITLNRPGSLNTIVPPMPDEIEAADSGLINKAVPFAELEATVQQTARQLASIPLSQLSAMKLIVNQAYENMGLAAVARRDAPFADYSQAPPGEQPDPRNVIR